MTEKGRTRIHMNIVTTKLHRPPCRFGEKQNCLKHHVQKFMIGGENVDMCDSIMILKKFLLSQLKFYIFGEQIYTFSTFTVLYICFQNILVFSWSTYRQKMAPILNLRFNDGPIWIVNNVLTTFSWLYRYILTTDFLEISHSTKIGVL